MNVLQSHNVMLLAAWDRDAQALVAFAQSDAVAGDVNQKTALVHALFWKKWWAYAN